MADADDGLAPIDPAERGRLDIRARAVENIVVASALRTDGVVRHGAGLGRLAGRDLPRVKVDVAGDHVRAAVFVAVPWGRPLASVAAAVKGGVTDVLANDSGLCVDGVTVHVAAIIPPGQGAGHRTLS